MSKATHAAVEEALRTHLADELNEPLVMTDWVVLTAYQGLDDTVTGYFYITREGMSAHVLTGLVGYFLNGLRYKHAIEATSEDDE